MQVSRKLAVGTPSSELVDAYLSEIAKGYGLAFLSGTGSAKEVDPLSDEHDTSEQENKVHCLGCLYVDCR